MDFKPENTSTWIGVVHYFEEIFIFVIIATILILLNGLRHIKASYLQRTPLQTVGNLFWSTGLGMALTVLALALLEYKIPNASIQAKVGVSVFIGLFGMKGLDWWFRYKFGQSVADFMDPRDLDEIYQKLTPEQRAQHLSQCVFRRDCPHQCSCENREQCVAKHQHSDNGPL